MNYLYYKSKHFNRNLHFDCRSSTVASSTGSARFI